MSKCFRILLHIIKKDSSYFDRFLTFKSSVETDGLVAESHRHSGEIMKIMKELRDSPPLLLLVFSWDSLAKILNIELNRLMDMRINLRYFSKWSKSCFYVIRGDFRT